MGGASSAGLGDHCGGASSGDAAAACARRSHSGIPSSQQYRRAGADALGVGGADAMPAAQSPAGAAVRRSQSEWLQKIFDEV